MTDECHAGSKFVRVFATKKEWRGFMNNLIGKKIMFQKPLKDVSDAIYSHVGCLGEVEDCTDDLLQVLVVELSSGNLYVVPIEAVRVLHE